MPFGVMLISEFVTSDISALPESDKLDSDEPPSSVYISEKLSLILSNADLNGSPVPSLAADPIPIVCFAIVVFPFGVDELYLLNIFINLM